MYLGLSLIILALMTTANSGWVTVVNNNVFLNGNMVGTLPFTAQHNSILFQNFSIYESEVEVFLIVAWNGSTTYNGSISHNPTHIIVIINNSHLISTNNNNLFYMNNSTYVEVPSFFNGTLTFENSSSEVEGILIVIQKPIINNYSYSTVSSFNQHAQGTTRTTGIVYIVFILIMAILGLVFQLYSKKSKYS